MKKLLFLFFLFTTVTYGQKSNGYKNEVGSLQQKYDSIWDASKETTVFAGSSTIRMWKNLEAMFPDQQIINSGFGGSQSSDLYRYHNELILQYNPKKVFIYEGDNDIASKKKTKEIIATTREIIHKIKENDRGTQVVIIAAKPSLARWKLKRKYIRLNRAFEKLCKRDSALEFANVWDVMMDGKQLRKDIFLNDGLHMNYKGYNLWYLAIEPFMN